MKAKRTAQLLLICLFVLAASHSEAYAQKRQVGVRDSSSSSGAAKSTVSKSYIQKSYENKQGAEFQNLKYSRMYAVTDQCAFVTNKGIRCKRKAQTYSRYCRQHDDRLPTKDKQK
jgi:hypothetical protein